MRRLQRDEGFSLVELNIAALIVAFVLAITGTALVMMARTDSTTEADTESLTTLRFARDNIEKDVRAADEILSPSTKTSLRLWLDVDDNNAVDTNETVIWAFEVRPDGGANLVRTVEDSGERFVAGEGLVNPAATYDAFTDDTATPTSATKLLRVELRAESKPGTGNIESITTLIHLRNKP